MAGEESGNRGLTNNEKQLIVYMMSLQQEEGDSTESVLCWLVNKCSSVFKTNKIVCECKFQMSCLMSLSLCLEIKVVGKGPLKLHPVKSASSTVVLFLSYYFLFCFHLGYDLLFR